MISTYFLYNYNVIQSEYFENNLHLKFVTKTSHDELFLNFKLCVPTNLYSITDIKYVNGFPNSLANFSLKFQNSVITIYDMLKVFNYSKYFFFVQPQLQIIGIFYNHKKKIENTQNYFNYKLFVLNNLYRKKNIYFHLTYCQYLNYFLVTLLMFLPVSVHNSN